MDRKKLNRERGFKEISGKKHSISPTIAPGMDNEELNKEATPEAVKKGDFTEVTTLSYDEIDPS